MHFRRRMSLRGLDPCERQAEEKLRLCGLNETITRTQEFNSSDVKPTMQSLFRGHQRTALIRQP